MRECRRKSRWPCADAASQLCADTNVMTSSAALGLSPGHNVDGSERRAGGDFPLDEVLECRRVSKGSQIVHGGGRRRGRLLALAVIVLACGLHPREGEPGAGRRRNAQRRNLA